MAFPRCVIAAADRGSECLKLPYFLQQFVRICISIVPIEKREAEEPLGKVVVGIQVVVIFSFFFMKSKPRKKSRRLEPGRRLGKSGSAGP